ncbi:MAG: hypothetical protein CMJ72_12905 [Planctomycetaceae bacterium]|nr:hypothetical protein [Planctomycetaceae bacterium]MCH2596019.1 hypothetical protein [Pirellulales bacterium]
MRLADSSPAWDNTQIMPRFVLLFHNCPEKSPKPSHWDLMFEHQDVLMTWELRELPATWQKKQGEGSETVSARRLKDHRLAYLDYEGPVSGDRGHVTQCDSGLYECLQQSDQYLELRLVGKKLQGIVRLQQNGPCWQLALVTS